MACRNLIFRALFVLFFILSNQASANIPLNGLSVHQDLGKEQFIAGLYSDNLTTDADSILSSSSPAAMELRVVAKRLSRRRFNRMWIEGSSINNPGSVLTAQADNMVKFTGLFKKKLVAGDHVRIERNAAGGTDITVNEVQLGSIADPEFFPVLLRTWVGRVPLSSSFRSDLLADGNFDQDLYARYNATNPSEARNDEVLAWKADSTDAALAAGATAGAAAIAAPTISKPKAAPAISKPKETQIAKVDAPVIAAPTIAAPTLNQAEPIEEPAPTPEPQKPQAAPIEDEDEDEDDYTPMTAESLLARQIYISTLLRYTQVQIKKYPSKALRKGQEGSVRMSVNINRSGDVQDYYLVEGTDYSSLNKAVEKAIKKADPYPPMPVNITGDSFSFPVVVNFRLPK